MEKKKRKSARALHKGTALSQVEQRIIRRIVAKRGTALSQVEQRVIRRLAEKRLPGFLKKQDAWVDPDDAPPWTQEQLDSADLYRGDKLVRRGRPPSDNPKVPLKLRIDPDVVEYFRATGPGWQTRINDVLRRAAKLPASPSIRSERERNEVRPGSGIN